PDLVTTSDYHGHTVIKVPYKHFLRIWKPFVDDTEGMKKLASVMTGPLLDRILKLDFKLDQSPELVCFVVTCHERADVSLNNCINCGLVVN
ncbi:hypothetical protein LCGC14_2686660, partial [marine sediment metagenome]